MNERGPVYGVHVVKIIKTKLVTNIWTKEASVWRSRRQNQKDKTSDE